MKKPKIKKPSRAVRAKQKAALLAHEAQAKIASKKASSSTSLSRSNNNPNLTNAASGASQHNANVSQYRLYTDGSHFQEYQAAGIGGYLLSPNNKTVFEFSRVLNNPKVYEKHEIMALEAGLLEASRHKIKTLKCYTDDQKLAEILNIRNETKRAGYIQSNPYLEHVNVLLRRFDSITFEYLPRTRNKRADKLSRQSLLEKISHLNRLVDNGLSIPNFYCTQQYSKNETALFGELKKDIAPHIAFNIKEISSPAFPDLEAGENTIPALISTPIITRYKIETCLGMKTVKGYTNKKITVIELKDNWQTDALLVIAKQLEKYAKLLNKNKPEGETLSVIIALEERQQILNRFLRGQTALKPEDMASVKRLEKACFLYEKIVLHSDTVWLKSVFQFEPYVLKPKAQRFRKELEYYPKPEEDDHGFRF